MVIVLTASLVPLVPAAPISAFLPFSLQFSFLIFFNLKTLVAHACLLFLVLLSILLFYFSNSNISRSLILWELWSCLSDTVSEHKPKQTLSKQHVSESYLQHTKVTPCDLTLGGLLDISIQL